MKKVYIYEVNRQTLKKRLFRIINWGYNSHFKTLKDVNDYINYLDDEKYYYIWEIM